ncbi:MAG TPA: 50S ribosomal protein L15 [Desulfobacterales bacterium]|uniref:LSU ribosomal protein L15p (L27Ae) n=1 Tax=hydrothermal vent metagenome TaxID=652676 RepID=A0A3B0W994_9ZZZZ|nr:50S ribosomal protein L15 [Desulfobacterales bacterium]
MLTLSNLSPQPGSTKQKKRLGRGQGSGHGKTAARGENGYKSRSGSSIRPGFEGGQMPLHRRLPKRGFTNIFKSRFAVINVDALEKFDDGAVVDRQALLEKGLIGRKYSQVKLLGNGDISKKLTIKVDRTSATARQKIEAAGGKVEE